MVSYEVSIGFVIITVLLCVGSLNLSEIVVAQAGGIHHWFCSRRCCRCSSCSSSRRWPKPTARRSTCRRRKRSWSPGYNVEYSAMTFALFFLGEYANMILMSGMTAILFLGGWLPPFDFAPFTWIPGPIWFALKIAAVLFVFLWVRATFPRYRYDQLMRLGWKVFLPLSLLWVVLTAGWLLLTGTVPPAGGA